MSSQVCVGQGSHVSVCCCCGEVSRSLKEMSGFSVLYFSQHCSFTLHNRLHSFLSHYSFSLHVTLLLVQMMDSDVVQGHHCREETGSSLN